MLFQHIRKQQGFLQTAYGKVPMGQDGIIDTDQLPAGIDPQKVGALLASMPDVFKPVRLNASNQVVSAKEGDVAAMSYSELKAYARTMGLDVPANISKADLLAMIENQVQAQAQKQE